MYVTVSGALVHDETDVNPRDVIVEGSVSGPVTLITPTPDGLTDLQSAFIDAFIQNGGRAGEAAVTAGYGGGAENMGLRNLAKPKIQAEIQRRLKTQAGSALAAAIGRLLKIIETSTDDRAAVAAALGLMDRFGMAPPKGPAIVNNIAVMNGNAAQAILIEVQERRQQRLAQHSDAIDG
jgi:hypothetical protein